MDSHDRGKIQMILILGYKTYRTAILIELNCTDRVYHGQIVQWVTLSSRDCSAIPKNQLRFRDFSETFWCFILALWLAAQSFEFQLAVSAILLASTQEFLVYLPISVATNWSCKKSEWVSLDLGLENKRFFM